GQFSKAEPYMERELRAREKGLGPEHPAVVALVGKIAQFYLAHGSPQKGEKICSLLLNFADRKVKEEQFQSAQLAKLGAYYDKSKDYGEAHKLLSKLQEETHRADANENLELATTLDTLGQMFKSRGNFDVAEKM